MDKTFSKLYSRASNGSVRYWTIEVDGSNTRTIYGQLAGKEVITSWYPALATNLGRANERNPNEQAMFEAERLWIRQQEGGYFLDVKDIDNGIAYVEVMLANHYSKVAAKKKSPIDWKKKRYGLQRKFNGNRCIARLLGFQTRKGKFWKNCQHIIDTLEEFFILWPEAVLDGELYNYALRQKLNELSKIIKQQTPTPEEIQKSLDMVRFYIYDGYGFAGMDEKTPYHIRKAWIDKNVIEKFKFCELVETFEVKSEEEMFQKYQEFLDDEEEGGILRDLDSEYEHDRSNNLLKVKPEDDSEGKIISILEGKGNDAGTAKTALVEWEGIQFECTFMGTREQRRDILKNQKDWISKKPTFIYIGLTGKGVPNSGRINPNNCFSADR